MRIKLQGFMGKLHSWSCIHWALSDEWVKMGHQVEMFSTDGIKHFPKQKKKNLIGYTEENKQKVIGKSPSGTYDMQFSYTAMKNFNSYNCFYNWSSFRSKRSFMN